MIETKRIGAEAIVHSKLSDSIKDNINGPSLIARPAWAPGDGRYLLYFAHHYGRHIRLAVADHLEGPWRIHEPGVLRLETTPFAQTPPQLPQPDWAHEFDIDAYIPHVASPDVHVNDEAQRLEMLFHGLAKDGEQKSYFATSADGLDWHIEGPAIMQTYLRRFELDGVQYAVGLGGQCLRAKADGDYELGPWLLSDGVRHVAVLRRGLILHVLFTRIGDQPERILHCEVSLADDWRDWRARGEPREVLRPELDWEGASLPVVASRPGQTEFTHALRDPAFFEEERRLCMVYAGGGEAALGIAEIKGI